MTCPQCLAEVPADAVFCSGCGTRVDRTPTPLRSMETPMKAPGAPRWEQPPQAPDWEQPRQARPWEQSPQGWPREQPPQGWPREQPPQGWPREQPPQGWPREQPPEGRHREQAPQAPPWGSPEAPRWNPPGPPARSAAGRHVHGTPPPAPLPPVQFDLGRLTAADRAIGGASLLALITLFLPWFGFSEPGYSYSQGGITAHAYLGIALLADLVIVGYLVMRACWEVLPVKLPVAHAPLLLVATGLQLLIVLIAFLFKPTGLSWEIGAYLALLAAVAACAPIAVPALRWWQENQG
jgi:hypothetical protein